MMFLRHSLFTLVVVVALAGCGDGGGVGAPVNNSTSTNNETTSSNNQTTSSNNATTSNNATNNATSSTNNMTSATNNQPPVCQPIEPALGTCDVVCQTGCEVGEHCLASGDPLEAFCEASGLGTQGDACAADTECALGLHCRSVSGGSQICMTYCGTDNGDADCPTGHACVALAADQRVGACVEIVNSCDSVPMDTCADPDECYDTVSGRQCLPAGDGAIDTECTRSSDCAPGLRCVGVGDGTQNCRPLCDPNGDGSECDDNNCNELQNSDGQPLSWGACI